MIIFVVIRTLFVTNRYELFQFYVGILDEQTQEDITYWVLNLTYVFYMWARQLIHSQGPFDVQPQYKLSSYVMPFSRHWCGLWTHCEKIAGLSSWAQFTEKYGY